MAVKKKNKNQGPGYHHFSYAIVVVVVTAAAFYPSVGNNFVNWDDVVYIMNNDMIKTISFSNLTRIFSSFFMGNYHPMTMLSFAFDYSIFKVSAPGYHLHNLILHLINAVLVFFVSWHLFRKNDLVAFIVSILFAIHPMHVESVAWVSERKDLLFTMYFLLAMLSYTFYNKTSQQKYLYYTLGCFLLSLLSKAQAVSLPIVLLLIDYFMVRKPGAKMFLEKIPFFALSLVFGIIAIKAQDADGSINSFNIPVVNSLFYAQYSVFVYLFKLFLPINLTCLYEYPVTEDGGVPFYIYLSPIVIIVLLFILLKTWKKQPSIFFGLLFFLVVIFPVLQFLPVGRALVAERYSYTPYIGLFIIIAVLFVQLRDRIKSSGNKKTLNYIGIGVILTLCILTWNRTKVWGDSVSLWTDVMQKNPSCMSAYINRSFMYIQYKQFDKAIQDCNDGLKIDSSQSKLYVNRATAYRHLALYDLALVDFTAALRENPKSYDTYQERGILYTDRFLKFDSAISDFRYFLKFRPDDKHGNYNLAVAYYKKQNYDSALYFCAKTLELSPDYADAYYIRAITCAARMDFAKAYEYGTAAQSLGYTMDKGLVDGWRKKANIIIPDLK
ncbi:MAG: tetratricopeptide repeat protein [Bacteroidetes bacterium]|nr:tetratricopeptide repeat protein [Bacteroidota bacterium]